MLSHNEANSIFYIDLRIFDYLGPSFTRKNGKLTGLIDWIKPSNSCRTDSQNYMVQECFFD